MRAVVSPSAAALMSGRPAPAVRKRPRPAGFRSCAYAWSLVCACVLLGGCTSFTPVRLDPATVNERAHTKSVGQVGVSVAILTDEQAGQHFGTDLGTQGVQALWVRVYNGSRKRLWFVRNIVDPDFYSPEEAAQMVREQVPPDQFEAMRQHFRDESIRVLLRPLTVTEGFIFLPRQEGGRYIDIRLAADAYEAEASLSGVRGEERAVQSQQRFTELRFGFALPLPDGHFDYERLQTSHTYEGRELPSLDTQSLRETLEQLPCCATDADGEDSADPLNVVLIGNAADVMNALTRSGWSFTHRISPDSVRRLIDAAVNGKPYPVAPVSSLYLFGRKQDFALQRARPSIAQRNHMRLWLAPFLHQGEQVWIGQISRDIGVKLSSKSPTLTTHIIDPEVDLTREYLLHSLLAEGLVERFGFVSGSMEATRTQPAYNLTDDPYFSDGMRLVVMLSPDPLPYSKVHSLLWEQSGAPVAEGQSEAAQRYVRPIESPAREPQ